MIIRKIRLFNFGVYFDEQTISPVTGKNKPKVITLIGGINGGGKTSLLDAILLALYGNRSISLRNSGYSYSDYLKSLINKDTALEEGAAVEIDLEIPNEIETTKLTIKRSWKLANVRVTDHLEVWRDGEPDLYLAETWDSYVEQLIPSGISGLFFFDGEKVSTLAEAEETPASIQKAIRSILGLDIVERLIQDLGSVIRRNKARIKNPEVQKKFFELQNKKEQLNLKLNIVRQNIAKTNVDLERINQQLEQKKESYLYSGGPIAELRNDMQNDLESLQEEYYQIKAELNNLAAGPLPLLLLKPMLEKIREQAHIERKIKEAISALNLLITRNQEVRSILSNLTYDSQVIADVEEILTSQEEELKILAGVELDYSVSPRTMVQVEELLTRLDTELLKKANELLGALNKNELQQENINRHLEAEINSENISVLLKEITTLSETKAKLEQSSNDLEKEYASLNYELKLINGQLKKLTDELSEVEEAERIIRYAIKSRETMRIFKARVTKTKIENLAEEILKAFHYLTHKNDLIKNIVIDPRTLKIDLQDKKGRKIIKARLSSGERQMLAIAILWGLAKASGKKLPVIIDTPMGRLDSSHRMNFVTRYLPKAGEQVIVLSTDTEIIGPYLSKLEPYIGRKYLLNYNDETQQTTIEQGYFEEPKGATLLDR